VSSLSILRVTAFVLCSAIPVLAAKPSEPDVVKPTRAEIYDHLGPSAPAPAASPVPYKELMHDVTIRGTLPKGLRLDIELQYRSTNRFKDVIVGGKGWVKMPEERMERPGVTYEADGHYTIKFKTFLQSFWGARYQLLYARLAVLKQDCTAAYFDVRTDYGQAAPEVLQANKVLVKTGRKPNGEQPLSLEVHSFNCAVADQVFAVSRGNGWSAAEINFEEVQ
jgi:hypothetical protein